MTPSVSPLLTLLLAMLIAVRAVPQITSFTKVVTLNENSLTNVDLSTIVCSNPAGDPTRTYIRSVQPGSPCQNCFTILDCGGDECLQYRAGVGRLDHDITSLYLITVSCEDPSRNTATEVIQVVIIPNQPPTFKPDSLETSWSVNANTNPGDTIGTVKAEDDDGDHLTFTMEVIPSSVFTAFSIANGAVVANVDLRTLCRSFVTLQVKVTDGQNTVGPKVIAVSFTNNRVKPIATNLNTEIQIPEDTTGDIFTYLFVPANGLTYTVTSTTADGFAQFTSKNEKLKVATALNYEDENLRVTDLSIKVTDGYCESDTYSLQIKVTDVNEAPVISETDVSVETCEGRVEFMPPFTMTDPDEEDTHIWAFDDSRNVNNDDGLFFIHPDTGLLGTNMDYDVDPDYDKPKKYSAKFTYKIKVTDKGGLSATATVSATFLDCNDNAPRFSKAFFTFTANECTGPGSILGRLTADDADSKREGNNEYAFSGAAGAVDIGETGNVILTKTLQAGTVVVFDAYVTDKGQTPGPLRSEQPAKVSVIFGECPPVSDGAGSDSSTGDGSDVATKSGNKVPWIVVAAVLGALLLGLLSFMMWRYWDVMGQACSNLNCSKSFPTRHYKHRTAHR